ncbi:MAG: type III pantothenate kinase [Bacteroidetes bacterium]|nr:type III pantothenate kinase [Bacteroidota bacterium]
MKLVLDIGNTQVKAGFFENKKLVEVIVFPELSVEWIESTKIKHPGISNIILSSVGKVSAKVIEILKNNFHLIELSETTAIPINNLYKSPDTLGKDRLAGVIAAHSLYPEENILVIDAGTCITFDMVSIKGEYKGGSISPGFLMRFKSLHTFTAKLPLVSLTNYSELIGTDTETSILSGVINGLCAETDAIIDKYKGLYKPLRTIICGGDAKFLADRLKNSIFAVPELVLIGLNEILDYNEQ